MTNPRDPFDPLEAFLEAHGAAAVDDLIEWAEQLGAATPAQRVATTQEYRRARPGLADISALIEQFGVEQVIESLGVIRTREHRAGFRLIDGDMPG